MSLISAGSISLDSTFNKTFYLKINFIPRDWLNKLCGPNTSVSEPVPDPHGSALILVTRPTKIEKGKTFHVLKCWMFFFEGWRPRISKHRNTVYYISRSENRNKRKQNGQCPAVFFGKQVQILKNYYKELQCCRSCFSLWYVPGTGIQTRLPKTMRIWIRIGVKSQIRSVSASMSKSGSKPKLRICRGSNWSHGGPWTITMNLWTVETQTGGVGAQNGAMKCIYAGCSRQHWTNMWAKFHTMALPYASLSALFSWSLGPSIFPMNMMLNLHKALIIKVNKTTNKNKIKT